MEELLDLESLEYELREAGIRKCFFAQKVMRWENGLQKPYVEITAFDAKTDTFYKLSMDTGDIEMMIRLKDKEGKDFIESEEEFSKRFQSIASRWKATQDDCLARVQKIPGMKVIMGVKSPL